MNFGAQNTRASSIQYRERKKKTPNFQTIDRNRERTTVERLLII